MKISNLNIFIFILSLSSILSAAFSRSHRSNITWWCQQTPHPRPCDHFMARDPHRFAPRHFKDFRYMAVQVAIDQALANKARVEKFGPSCRTGRQRHAWSDCLKLYSNTILQLNRTFQGIRHNRPPNGTCSVFDAQTWLSTALTNIRTCELGLSDLNVTYNLEPIVSQNLSQLISNTLAINSYFLRKKKTGDDHGHDHKHSNRTAHFYPRWLPNGDRRLLLSSSSPKSRANLVVASDGSGHFRTVQAAIDAAAKRKVATRFIIYVKAGNYNENIEVGPTNNNIMLVGDGMKYTIITGSRSVAGGYTTYSTATAGIDGLGFIARDITFRNKAGPSAGQAVALRSASDLSVFYRCGIQGYQDTLFVHSQRQFYRECYIFGTIDFIFGNAAVVFQKCNIIVRRPAHGQANIITAQGRADPYQNTGIAIHNSRIVAGNDLKPVVRSFSTFLGRPWQQYSRTVILTSYIDSLVSPLGWSTWLNSDFALDTLYYGEYKNYGPSSATRWRVNWRGFHVITSPTVAASFTVNTLLAGGSWLPATGVPFTLGL